MTSCGAAPLPTVASSSPPASSARTRRGPSAEGVNKGSPHARQHVGRRRACCSEEGLEEGRLADPRLAADDYDAAASGSLDGREGVAQRRQLPSSFEQLAGLTSCVTRVSRMPQCCIW